MQLVLISVWEKGTSLIILKLHIEELQLTVVLKWHSDVQPPISQMVMLLAVNT
jgi:hypothetical protein